VTSQPQPAPAEAGSPGQYLRPLRDIAAYALVGATAVMLFVAVVRLIPSGVGQDFGSRAQDSFYSYVNVPTIFFPLAAVLLSLLVRPRHPKAKLITVIAVVEYGVAGAFAIVFGILIGLINIASFSVRTAFEELLVRVAWLAVFAVAAFATYQIWRHLFYTPKPKPQPGVYGHPQYGVPGAYPGQPGYGQPGQPGPPGHPGQPGPLGHAGPAGYPGQPPQPGQPGQPGHPGQPAPAGYGRPAYGQPPIGNTGHPGPAGQPAYPGQQPPAPGAPGQPAWNQQGFGSQPVYPGASQPPAATQPVPAGPAVAETQPVPSHPASAEPASTQPFWGESGAQHASARPFPAESGAQRASTESSSTGPGAARPTSAQPSSGSPSGPPGPFAPEPGHVPGPYSAPGSTLHAPGAETSQGALSEPTQVVPQHHPTPPADDEDRTQIVGDDRPGDGAAERDRTSD
jgi:hypothetical protein